MENDVNDRFVRVRGAAEHNLRNADVDIPRDAMVALVARIEVLLHLGLGYLSLGRRSTTLSPGEAQRLRIATQLRSGQFGVVYVLDEPSAGLHPADAEPLHDVSADLPEPDVDVRDVAGLVGSNCCSCPVPTRRAPPATARGTTRRRWR
ncbi:hypothetical protein [Paractinoplanes atraurantiacus]|uniref:UvrABC system protein A n=1 Tax=Paractinoplanes atraurantiacus TaxID=1036182 RepID=A0A285JJQ3_9ACTN|nr:hypothetical protein [Actinoplanes atraurantiacus]SNY60293.1 hypothetical protein SAMN05421748_12190 [Actinoplanes atraurantiacus]